MFLVLNIESAFLSALIVKSAYLSVLILVDVFFFDVSHTPPINLKKWIPALNLKYAREELVISPTFIYMYNVIFLFEVILIYKNLKQIKNNQIMTQMS